MLAFSMLVVFIALTTNYYSTSVYIYIAATEQGYCETAITITMFLKKTIYIIISKFFCISRYIYIYSRGSLLS